MVMQMMRKGAGGGLIKFFLFGILGLSVGGLALMDVRGVLQGSSVGGSDVVRVGDETINIRTFDRTLRRSLAQYRIQTEQAYKLGLVNEILSGQIRSYLLAQTAKEKGFDLNKELMALRVAEIVKPNLLPEQTMQEALEQLLQRQGMGEDEFVSTLKREVAGEYLMRAVRGGYSFDKDLLVGELYKFQNQTRDIEAIFFVDKDMKGIEPSSEEELKKLYDRVKATQYKVPEYRTIKMAVFDPEKLDVNVEVSDEEIKQTYKDNKDAFTIGEKVVLSQSLVDTPEQAQAIYDEVQTGKSLKDAVEVVASSAGGYFEGRDFEVVSMIPEMAKAVEGLEEGNVAEPIKTMLGHHVVRLDERIESTVRPLEEVQDEIREALFQEKHDKEIYEISQELDESLDGGTSFDELAKNEAYPLEIKVFGPFDKNGLTENEEQGLKPIADQDRKELLELAYELAEGEASLLQELPSGMLAAISIDSVEFESYTPFEKVKKEIAKKDLADRRHAKNFEIVAKHRAELGTGGSNFEGLAREGNKGIMNYKSIGLSGEMPSPLTETVRPTIFQTSVGDFEIVNLDDQFAIIRVSGYSVPEISQDEAVQETLQNVAESVDREMEDDAFLVYLQALAESRKPSINERLLKQVYDKAPQQ